jgi:hypothetical protein
MLLSFSWLQQSCFIFGPDLVYQIVVRNVRFLDYGHRMDPLREIDRLASISSTGFVNFLFQTFGRGRRSINHFI